MAWKQLWNENDTTFPRQHNSPKEKEEIRKSVPRQTDKKSRVPKEKKGSGFLELEIRVWNSQGGEQDKLFVCLFPLYIPQFSSVQFSCSLCLTLCEPILVNYTIQFKLCTRGDTTTMHPA